MFHRVIQKITLAQFFETRCINPPGKWYELHSIMTWRWPGCV